MQGSKMRETDILDRIRAGIGALSVPASVRIRIRCDLADTSVRVDPESIEKIFVDLGRNAIEAMPRGGDLTIGVEEGGEGIVITVKDTGNGISPADMDLLFTPFFTTKPGGEGTGLGLPSVYATVKAHMGRIAVASNADPQKGPTGTEIRITLPRLPPKENRETRRFLHDD